MDILSMKPYPGWMSSSMLLIVPATFKSISSTARVRASCDGKSGVISPGILWYIGTTWPTNIMVEMVLPR